MFLVDKSEKSHHVRQFTIKLKRLDNRIFEKIKSDGSVCLSKTNNITNALNIEDNQFKRRRSNDDEIFSVAKKICESTKMVVCFDCNEVFESRVSDHQKHACGTEQSNVIEEEKIKRCIEILNSKLKSTLKSPVCSSTNKIPPPPPLPPLTMPPIASCNVSSSIRFGAMDAILKGTTLRRIDTAALKNITRPSTQQQSNQMRPSAETNLINELKEKFRYSKRLFVNNLHSM